tara:strand:- start:168 stop:566 length:399 start_codon:yes stop_codon:yes gene_type:complete
MVGDDLSKTIHRRSVTMYTTVSEYDFREAFRTWQGGDFKDRFSYDGLGALFNWYESLEEDTGEQTELDVVAICCEFTEYESLEAFHDAHPLSVLYDHGSIEALKDHTTVIEFEKLIDFATNTKTDAFIIQNF